MGQGASGVWGDGTYIYVGTAASSNGLYGGVLAAFTFNGTSFTYLAEAAEPPGDPAIAPLVTLTGSGSYIYMADGAVVKAYTFNGSAFTYKGGFVVDSTNATEMIAKNGYLFDSTGGTQGDTYAFPLCQ
jgi:hypothetical protein